MEKVAGEVANLGYTIDTTDGVKIFKNEGWVIIRPSGTEPIFRCFSESNSQKKQLLKWLNGEYH